ncbi:MAG: 3-oxoacyl-ACP synthase [Crocinitomicaceae bacterium]|jgi:transcription elongation GreA/GreB family factor|nr:3-oxoacyl-ACP synthase [Crocinitomicaceae bacterium]|tara:strand:+ start:124 stop:573 length:450 start_codon:yes stop_codon:yes gene_type:complete
MPSLKSNWTKLIDQQLRLRLESLRRDQAQLEESKGSATKSSAGDKHETGRAMMEQELTRIQVQMESARKQLTELGQMPANSFEKVAWGTAVRTKQGVYFISVPLGRVNESKEPLFAISAGSPLGQLLLGKGAGDTVTFRGNEFNLLELH